ncbi:MAG: hypothetical protein K0B02_05015 [DPANN group archaeon]|nr:hypothetical protein [DPANN group archaeon]
MDKYKFELFGKLKKQTTDQQASVTQSAMTHNLQIPSNTQQIPTELITQLSSQGLSEAEIIKQLKQKGYSFGQIDQALNATLKSSIDNRPVTHLGVFNNTQFNTQPQAIQQHQQPNMQQQIPQRTDSMLEAHIETIVEERLEMLKNTIESIENALERTHEEIDNLDISMKQLEKRNQETIEIISNKFDSLDTKFDNINPKIVSIEKAFKDVIPNIIDNMRELTEIVKKEKHVDIDMSEINIDKPITSNEQRKDTEND